eukprot:TRINITY_DN101903_c0_g1_i1.p1 TRINITY_DN101903_c0_g1~~TRINITY_DN101903_c0_g1_i1.p1  ORF type:complete len:173 (-),score=39.73 TRINITY_DN101903_c0_g1_i1:71-589(-)
MHQAYANHDFELVSKLKASWEKNDGELEDLDDDMRRNLSEEQRSVLLNGRRLVPGTCFKHKTFDYRGVILNSDPWCTYPASWRARWLKNRPQAEKQPFYHCLVDERDREGGQSRYVAEENIELSEFIFSIESFLVDQLLIQCKEIGGYLPGSDLEEALERQRTGGSFVGKGF